MDHTKPSANVYVQAQNQKVRVEHRPIDHAYLQVTFQDRDGNNKTIRLKLGTDEIFQDKQIKEFSIPANERFTQAERDAVRFKDGVLTTSNKTVQKFLEASPQFEGFWLPDAQGKTAGYCAEIKSPLYKLYDKTVEIESDDKMFKLRLAAANKIAGLTKEEGQSLMIRLNGSYFTPPDDEKEVRLGLVAFLDAANEAALNEILKEDINLDEEVTILLGKAIKHGIISFDKVENQVVKLKGDKIIPLKEISSQHDPDERKRYFSEFITSNAGKLLKNDLEKEVYAVENYVAGETPAPVKKEEVKQEGQEGINKLIKERNKKKGRPRKAA